MNITVLAAGTRGDVQPFAALAAGLAGAGHCVTLASSQSFAPLAAQLELDFYALDAGLGGWHRDVPRLMSESEGLALVESGSDFPAFVRACVAPIERAADSFLMQTWKACEGADAVVCSLLFSSAFH